MTSAQLAASLETSPEIIEAIAERIEAPTPAGIIDIWEDPEGADAAILAAAWKKAEPETEQLFWGDTVFFRETLA
jgi:accessory colonization factor AcfC